MSQFENSTQKFKGLYVRLYKSKLDYIDGILMGNWNNRYVTLCFQKDKASMVYIPDSEVKLIVPIKTYSLDANASICKNLYTNYN